MTKAEMIDSAQSLYATAGDSDQWISLTFFRTQYDPVMFEVARKTFCYPASATDSLADGVRLYIVPAGWFAFRPGGVQTADRGPLSGPRALEVIARGHKDWRTDEGTPTEWYQGDALKTSTPGTEVDAEYVGTGDGVETDFTLANTPLLAGTLDLYVDNVLQVEGATADFTVVLATSVSTFNAGSIPAAGEIVTAHYSHGAATVTNWAIGLRPVPDSDGTDELTLMGWGLPAASGVLEAGDVHVPPWPTPYHEIMTWGMCVRAAIRDQDRGRGNKAAMTYFQTEYQSMLIELRDVSLRGVDPVPIVRGAGAPAAIGAEYPGHEMYIPQQL